jgi:MFS family permease
MFSSWKFRHLGLAVLPIVIATPFVWLYAGLVADRVNTIVARRRNGRREPESHLLTLILPTLLGIVGTILYGYAAENFLTTHWMVLLFSIFLLTFAFFASATIVFVYSVESYPQWAG